MGFLNKYNHYIFVSSNFLENFFFRRCPALILIWSILKENLFEVGSWPETIDSRPKKDGFA